MPKKMCFDADAVRLLVNAEDDIAEIQIPAEKFLIPGDVVIVAETRSDMREANEPGWPAAYRATYGEDGWAVNSEWRSPVTMPLWAVRLRIEVLDILDAGEPQHVRVRVLRSPDVGVNVPDEDGFGPA